MTTRTLHSSHRSLDRHLRLVESSGRIALRPTVVLSAVDCFGLNRFLECFPNKSTVIDCSTRATAGASTVLFMQHEHVQQVVVASITPEMPIDESVQAVVQNSEEFRNGGGEKVVFKKEALQQASIWEQMLSDLDALSPIVLFVTPDRETNRFVEELQFLLGLHGSPAIVVGSVGILAEGTPLQQIVLHCRGEQHRTISLLRELSPFLGDSQLAVLYGEKDRFNSEMLRLTRMLFEGNFDFLSLLEDKLAADQRIKELEHLLFNAETSLHVLANREEAQTQAFAPETLHSVESLGEESPAPEPISKMLYFYQQVVPAQIRAKLRRA